MKRSTFFLLCMLSSAVVLSQFPCEDGVANGYPCSGLDLMSHLSLDALGGGENGNDCWGWVDPNSGREFVLFGRHNGLSIVEVTDPVNPVYLANVPTASSGSRVPISTPVYAAARSGLRPVDFFRIRLPEAQNGRG